MKDSEPTTGLVSEAREAATLDEAEIAEMWALFARYYGGVSEALFRSDLAGKTHAIVSRDETGRIGGFSTVEVFEHEFGGRKILVLFSGDTIIGHEYWARNDFAFSWIRFAAAIGERWPDLPLYWLLIVKGHRTYRYLSVFGRRYYPAAGWPTPPDTQALMDSLADTRFGDAYIPDEGLVRFAESHGHLKAPWSEIPEAALSRREVAYFLERNPGYRGGDELVCLCEVSRENMKPLTRRVFDGGKPHARAR